MAKGRLLSCACLVLTLCTITSAYPYFMPRCGRDRPRLQNGFFKLIDATTNVIQAECSEGFELVGDKIRICNLTTGFSGTPAQCQDVDECALFEEGSGGDGWPEWAGDGPCHSEAVCTNRPGYFTCSCKKGFYGDGRTCLSLPCSYPNVPNAIMTPRGRGDRVSFSCKEHHTFIGHTFLRCNTRRGTWDHPPPRCAPYPRCHSPVPIENGQIYYKSDENYFIGARVGFMCDEGYQLRGEDFWTCTHQLLWGGQEDTYCKKIGLEMMGNSLRSKLDTVAMNTKMSVEYNANARFDPNDPKGVDLVFLLDTSSSVTRSNFNKGVDFLSLLLQELKPNPVDPTNTTGLTRIAVVTFADEAKTEFSFDDSAQWGIAETERRLKSIVPGGGGTNLIEGLEAATMLILDNLRDPSPLNIVFIISDGMANAGDMSKIQLKAVGLKVPPISAEIFTIGIGSHVRREQLEEICSKPELEHRFVLSDYNELARLRNYVIDKRLDYEKCGISGDTEGPSFGQAKENAWPWDVQVKVTDNDGNQLACGGSLICKKWVVTAAQCVNNVNRDSQISVNLGLKQGDSNEYVDVWKVHLHPDFRRRTPHIHDLALLQLRDEAPLAKPLRTVCVPKTESIEIQIRQPWKTGTGEHVYNTGWGSEEREKYFYYEHVNYVKTGFMPPVLCNKMLDSLNVTTEERANLGCLHGGGSTEIRCRGDIGGPVVWKSTTEKTYQLVAVPTHTSLCSTKDKYTVVTKLFNYLDWIKNTTADCNTAFLKVRPDH